jgi:molybdopterin converting factor small subunit
LVVHVTLHTALQRKKNGERITQIDTDLPEGTTLADLLIHLNIRMNPESLILVINHHVADSSAILKDSDEVDLIPAMSGG